MTLARTCRSTAMRSTRSPARAAIAASSSAASRRCRAAARRRPARRTSRPVSRTMMMRRSRSGRQVRTRTSRTTRSRPPVDRADVVADHVLAQRVELACPGRGSGCGAVRRAGAAGQLLRQVLTAQERRQHPHRPGRRAACLPAARPSGPSELTVTCPAALSPRRVGRERRGHRHAGRRPGSRRRTGPVRLQRSAARRPGRRRAAAAGPDCRSSGSTVPLLTEQDRGVTGPGQLQLPDASRENQIECDRGQDDAVDREQPG